MNDARAKAYLWAADALTEEVERLMVPEAIEVEVRAIAAALRAAAENRAAAPEVPPPGPMVAPGYRTRDPGEPGRVIPLDPPKPRPSTPKPSPSVAKPCSCGYAPNFPRAGRHHADCASMQTALPMREPPAIEALPPVPAVPCPRCHQQVADWATHGCGQVTREDLMPTCKGGCGRAVAPLKDGICSWCAAAVG